MATNRGDRYLETKSPNTVGVLKGRISIFRGGSVSPQQSGESPNRVARRMDGHIRPPPRMKPKPHRRGKAKAKLDDSSEGAHRLAEYEAGQYVFTKIKGHPVWPSKVRCKMRAAAIRASAASSPLPLRLSLHHCALCRSIALKSCRETVKKSRSTASSSSERTKRRLFCLLFLA